MKKEDLFYVLFFSTIILIRLGVFLFPEREIRLASLIIHHFWIGIILIIIPLLLNLLFNNKYEKLRLFTFAIGLGLIIDQFVFMILGAGTDVQYWAMPSLFGMIFLSCFILIFRKIIFKSISINLSSKIRKTNKRKKLTSKKKK